MYSYTCDLCGKTYEDERKNENTICFQCRKDYEISDEHIYHPEMSVEKASIKEPPSSTSDSASSHDVEQPKQSVHTNTGIYRKKCSVCGQLFTTHSGIDDVCPNCVDSYKIPDKSNEATEYIKKMYYDIHVIKNIVVAFLVWSIIGVVAILLYYASLMD